MKGGDRNSSTTTKGGGKISRVLRDLGQQPVKPLQCNALVWPLPDFHCNVQLWAGVRLACIVMSSTSHLPELTQFARRREISLKMTFFNGSDGQPYNPEGHSTDG